MPRRLALLLLGVVIAFTAPPARAALITFDISEAGTIGFAGPSFVGTATGNLPEFARFDGGLGTLTHVSLQLLGTASAGRFVMGPAVVDVFVFQSSELRDGEGSLLASRDGPIAESSASVPDGDTKLVGDGDSFFSTFEVSDVARFLGSNALAITVRARLELDGNEVTPDAGSMAFRTLAVGYTYTPIPEPGTASLLAGGIVGVAVRRRRRGPAHRHRRASAARMRRVTSSTRPSPRADRYDEPC